MILQFFFVYSLRDSIGSIYEAQHNIMIKELKQCPQLERLTYVERTGNIIIIILYLLLFNGWEINMM